MRRVSYVVMAVCAAGLVAGQAEAQSREIGFKLGPSFATLSGIDDGIGNDLPGASVNTTTRSGLAAGGFFRVGFGPASIQTELLYAQKGGGVEGTDPDLGSAEVTLELDYVEVPVLLRLAIPAGMLLRSYVYAGPAVAFEVGCHARVEALGLSFTDDCDDDDFNRRKVDAGLMFGGGLGLPVGVGGILLEARYTMGLINLDDNPDSTGDVKNRALNVFAGFSIPLR